MLGMGFSGRPRFPKVKEGKRDNAEDVKSRVEQAEAFFVNSLEEYRCALLSEESFHARR